MLLPLLASLVIRRIQYRPGDYIEIRELMPNNLGEYNAIISIAQHVLRYFAIFAVIFSSYPLNYPCRHLTLSKL